MYNENVLGKQRKRKRDSDEGEKRESNYDCYVIAVCWCNINEKQMLTQCITFLSEPPE